MAWHPAEADIGAFVTQCPEEVHDIADERVFGTFAHFLTTYNYVSHVGLYRTIYDYFVLNC